MVGWRPENVRVLNVKVGKKQGFLSIFVLVSLTLLHGALLGVNLLPCEWSWCLARSRQKKSQSQPDNTQKILIKPPDFTENQTVGTFPRPAFPLCFSPARFSPHFPAGWGTGVDAHGDAKHDPRILLGLGLSRAGFQEGRSPGQAVVDDSSEALRSGSQRGR